MSALVTANVNDAIDLSGEWPCVGTLRDGTPWLWDEVHYCPLDLWTALSEEDRAAVTQFLADKGRVIRPMEHFEGNGPEGVSHYPAPEPAFVSGSGGVFGYHVDVHVPYSPYSENVTLHVMNADSQEHAEWIAGQWLNDLFASGLKEGGAK